jgi:exopolysaccharide production protein ExoY
MLAIRDSSRTAQRGVDFICIVAGWMLARYLAVILSAHGLFEFPVHVDWQAEYLTLLLLGLLAWAVISTYANIYHSHRTESLPYVAGSLIRALLLWALITTTGAFAFKLRIVSRQFAAYFFGAAGVLIFARQIGTIVVLHRLRRFGYNWRTALIIGDRAGCDKFANLLTTAHPLGYRVTVMPDGGTASRSATRPDHERLARAITHVDEVFIVGGERDARVVEGGALGLLKQGKTVHIVPGLLDTRLFRRELGEVAGIPVVSLMKGELEWPQAAIKRAADVAAAALLLGLLTPVFALAAISVKLTSSGPVFFRQKRLGMNGRPFFLFKFRTMKSNAEELLKNSPELYAKYLANNFKLPAGEDPRITRLGAFLRASSLDELPQLLNVLKGDMSLVGPRPVVPAEIEKYGDAALLFLSAKPGMTGHWQVNGRSTVEEYGKRVELDLEYIRDQSLGKDVEILLRTVPAVLLRKGAH